MFNKLLQGKKTIIGTVAFLLLSIFVLVTGVAINGFAAAESWEVLLTVALLGIAGFFLPVGLADKIAKEGRLQEIVGQLVALCKKKGVDPRILNDITLPQSVEPPNTEVKDD